MAALEGTTWILRTLAGAPALPETVMTLSFEGGVAFGTDGCNRFRASYDVGDGGRFSVSPGIASTLMACPEGVMAQAAAFSAALSDSATVRLDAAGLALLDGSGTVRATFLAQSRDLVGTDWVVTGYNNGREAVVSVLAGTELTASFATGTVSGSAGCNRYRATFEVDGDRIGIGPAAATRRLCAEPNGVMEQESHFLAALETAAKYRLEGNRLELRTDDGALAVGLVRAP